MVNPLDIQYQIMWKLIQNISTPKMCSYLEIVIEQWWYSLYDTLTMEYLLFR